MRATGIMAMREKTPGSPENPLSCTLNLSIHRVRSKIDFARPRYDAAFDLGLRKKLRILKSFKNATQMAGLETHRTFGPVEESDYQRQRWPGFY
jgi:hypothetical protein